MWAGARALRARLPLGDGAATAARRSPRPGLQARRMSAQTWANILARGFLGRASPAGADSIKARERLLVQAGTIAGLACILEAAWLYGKSQRSQPDEQVWVGVRGPFSNDRAFALTPMAACLASGLLASVVAWRWPGHAASVSISYEVHQLLSVPLTLLVAFRFQGSYDRWWTSRKEIEMVATNTIDIAMCSVNNVDVLDTRHLERTGEHRYAKSEAAVANELRMLGILDALCFFCEEQVMRGKEPHPVNMTQEWLPGVAHLNREDAERCAAAADRVLWCLDSVVGTIHTAQKLGSLSPELASLMYDKTCSLHENLRQCEMVVSQLTPASFVVHMRTFLFLFCFSFPFTILKLRVGSILPMQAVVSFSLLGIEFASREMEHPFGEDESDVPCRWILQGARASIQKLRDGHQ